MVKTNAMRILEQAGIPYRAQEYEFDEDHLGGDHVVAQLGLDPDTCFKTLVARGDKKGIMGDGKDGHVGFGMKADISYTYFINELVGVGLNIDYTLGLNVSVDGAKAVHEVTPTIHTRLMF